MAEVVDDQGDLVVHRILPLPRRERERKLVRVTETLGPDRKKKKSIWRVSKVTDTLRLSALKIREKMARGPEIDTRRFCDAVRSGSH